MLRFLWCQRFLRNSLKINNILLLLIFTGQWKYTWDKDGQKSWDEIRKKISWWWWCWLCGGVIGWTNKALCVEFWALGVGTRHKAQGRQVEWVLSPSWLLALLGWMFISSIAIIVLWRWEVKLSMTKQRWWEYWWCEITNMMRILMMWNNKDDENIDDVK